ncbi:hypothetical protein SE27_07950 [Acinetobacter harbinensis]|uniref:hypothetical protein n=1 Tax=Acinetobacter harbinensis TaxID=1353941 RepID=UPI00057E792B|nr:hypothetical protein [Acinetobacter harbinensis]KWQ05193.1 hypothetical protein SE27_07950 [Acinetobacter harbinensis]
MANKKQTTLRILPPTKKVAHTAVMYGIFGFFAGAFISALGSYVYFNNLNTTPNPIEAKALAAPASNIETGSLSHQNPTVQVAEKPLVVSDEVTKNNSVPDDEHALEFPQPQDADLGKAFMHPAPLKPAVTSTKPAVSNLVSPSYATKNNTVKTTVRPKATTPALPLSTQITSTPVVKSEVQKKEIEVEDAPQASTKIVVTRTPFVVKETAVTP